MAMADGRLRAMREGEDASVTSGGRDLTVEQVAHETGMSVRNIRAYQSRGLLPPPEVRASTGYYGPEHVARLKLIREMQADGYNLNAIKRLINGSPGAAEQVLGLKQLVSTSFETEQSAVFTAQELAERFTGEADTFAKAEELQLLIPLGGQRYEVPNPSLLRAAEELMDRGVPLSAALSVVERIRRHCEGVSRAFTKLFLDEVWKPFEEAGLPDDRWPEVVEAIERLRPVASDTLLAVFGQTMTREVESAFGKVLERRTKHKR
jgi:DNA-binding transcriptional MerR regulator